MVREQKLINRILLEGKKQSDSIIKNAEKEALKLTKEAKQTESDFVKEQIKAEKQKLEQELSFAKALNNLEKNKIVLKEKSNILDEIFALVLQKLQDLKPSEYTKLLNGILKNAKTGDKLIISSKKGEKEKFLKLETFKKKKLSIDKTMDAISGGAIIVGKTFDFDFSFESLVKQKYEESLLKVVKNLF